MGRVSFRSDAGRQRIEYFMSKFVISQLKPMNKFFFSLLIALGCSFQVFSQDSLKLVKPSKYSMGLGMNVSGIISNIGLSSSDDAFGNDLVFARYYSHELVAWRMSLGLSGGQFQSLQTDSLGAALREFDSSKTKLNAFLGLGVERHIKTNGRLDPYFGGELSLGILGKTRIKSSTSLQDTSGTSRIEIDEQYKGGVQFGLHGIAGFNYFLTDNFALGAEYVLGYAFSSTGGDFDIITTNTPITGNPTIQRETGSQVIRRNTILTSSSIGVRISYFFTKPKKS